MESVNETWWYTYRRARNKARHQLSFEMICRKTLSEIWQEYLNHCSVAGVKQIRERNRLIKHRFMWLLVLGAAIGCAVYMLMDVWSATLTKPLIVTMDSSTYPIADIDFPAVAICNINRISKKNLKSYAEHVHRSRTHNYTLEQIEWYLREAGRLLDYSYSATDSAGMLSKFPRRNDGKQDDVVKIMEKLAPNCREMLLRCIWNGKIKNCSEIFFDRRTRLGHCCAFNYVLEYNSIGRPHRSKKFIGPVKRQSQYGWQHGLVVVMDAQLDDYAYPLRNVDGFDILLFDPNHYADPSAGHVLQRTVQPSSIMMFDMQSVKQVATEEVRKYPLSTRKCLFHDDLPDLYGEMYSYSACIANCKYNTIRALCKCSPYFIPIAKNEVPVCSLADLQCLNKYKEKIITMYPFNASSNQELQNELLNSLFCPECQPDCELTKHKLKTHKLQFVDGNIGDNYQMPEIVKDLNLNVSNTCIMCVFQGTSDGVLDRLDVVSYWYEILSNVGGFAGMLMGFSIITVVEIIYYLVVRFALIFIRNFKTYY